MLSGRRLYCCCSYFPSFSLEKKRQVIESQVSVNIMLYLMEHTQPWTSRTHTQMHLRWNTLPHQVAPLCGQVSCIIIKLGVSFRSKWECFVCKSARTLGLCGHCLCENLKKLRFSIPHHLEKGHKAVCCMLLLLNFLLLFSSTRWSSARFGKRNPTQTGRTSASPQTPPFSASVCWGVNVSAAPQKSKRFHQVSPPFT